MQITKCGWRSSDSGDEWFYSWSNISLPETDAAKTGEKKATQRMGKESLLRASVCSGHGTSCGRLHGKGVRSRAQLAKHLTAAHVYFPGECAFAAFFLGTGDRRHHFSWFARLFPPAQQCCRCRVSGFCGLKSFRLCRYFVIRRDSLSNVTHNRFGRKKWAEILVCR